MIPHTTPGTWPSSINPARFAAHIHAVPVGCRVAILGMPDDLGVRLNHGRPGAAQGPRAFRDALARYGVADPAPAAGFTAYPKVYDAGDIIPAHGSGEDALHETHRRISEAAAEIARLGMIPVGIGGGHDLTYALVRGVISASPGNWSGIYFDAHLDVRDTVGSGMPFRRLVEDCGVRTLHVHGLNPLVNTREHTDWFRSRGGSVRNAAPRSRMPGDDQHDDDLPPGHVFASFDLDVIDAAFAPGVSALNPAGWTPAQAAAWVDAVGLSPRVRCFDLMELCPPHDESGRTARLAAHLFLTFLRAVSERRG